MPLKFFAAIAPCQYLAVPSHPELYANETKAPYWFAFRYLALGRAQTQVSYKMMSCLNRAVP
jgi:hypothetical protein